MKKIFCLLAAAALMCTCAKEKEVEKLGSISGVVTDNTGEPIRAASVQLSTGAQTITGDDGYYEFTELKAGDYTLQVAKTGYTDLVGHKIMVEPNKAAKGDVQIEKLPPSLRVTGTNGQDIDSLAFGSDVSVEERMFNIFNDGSEALEWLITENCTWITELSESSGTIPPGKPKPISVRIDREKLTGGRNVYVLNIASDNGSKELRITAVGEVKILPTLNTLATSNVATSSATFNGEILTIGTPAYTERGFVYSLSPTPTVETSIEKVTAPLTTSKTFFRTITGLTLGKTYYVRAYAKSSVGTAYSSNEVSFEPEMVLPIVTTQEVGNKNIATGIATFNGTIVSEGDPAYTERGFVYGVQHNPTVGNGTKVESSGSGTGSFSQPITGLDEGTYYVRAYAKNTKDYAYGDEVVLNFNAMMPSPITQTVTNLSSTSVILNGSIASLGDPAYIEKGFVWGANSNPRIENSTKEPIASSGIGAFSKSLTGLTEGTTYHVNTYATYPTGTVYGTAQSFSTHITQVTGMVKNSSGVGINGATVVFKQGTTTVSQATTNSTGAFSISNMPVGAYTITTTVPGYIANITATSLSASQKTISITMSALGKIIGTLKDDDGIAMKSIAISLYSGSTQQATTSTNANGEFTFSNLTPGSYSIVASVDNHENLNAPITVVSGDNAKDYTMRITVPFAFDPGTLDASFIPMGSPMLMLYEGVQESVGTTVTHTIRIKNNRQKSLSWSLTDVPSVGITFSTKSGTVAANGVVSITATFKYPNTTGSTPVSLSGCSISSTSYTKSYLWNWSMKEAGYYFDASSNKYIQYNCVAYCSHLPLITVGEYSDRFQIIFNQLTAWK